MSGMEAISDERPPSLAAITADRAIALARWWLRLGAAFNILMALTILTVSVIGFRSGLGSTPTFIAAAVWFGVLLVSVRARRLVIDSVPLIAAGELGQAEDRLSQSLRAFSVLRSTRLLGLQQLALVRHSQANWADTAKLCRELIARRRPREEGLELPSRLMLSESLIELGQLHEAGAELGVLTGRRLNLRETLAVAQFQIELQVAAGQYAAALAALPTTLGMVELMPPPASARCHALLAYAAARQGWSSWQAFLSRRARLIGEVGQLVAARPFLRDVLVEPTDVPTAESSVASR